MAKLANAARPASRSSNGRKASQSRAKKSSPRSRPKRAASTKAASTKRTRATANSNARNGSLAQKAKAPALATGAIVLGVAGGTAAVLKQKRRGPRIPRPKGVNLPKSHGSTAAWVGEKAKEIGDAGYRVADLTSEVAKAEKSLRNR